MADTQRVSVGFEGGQVLSVRLSSQTMDELTQALKAGSGWHELRAEDGTAVIDLGKIVFVRTDDADHRVGFGL
jgi:hypothetical protein